MAKTREIYGDVESNLDLQEIFAEIREDVHQARSRLALTELYNRAGYLITLTHAPSWRKKFGDDVETLRRAAEEEFAKIAHKINRRAEAIGSEADYDETWGS